MTWAVKQNVGDRDEQQDDYSIDPQPDGADVDSLLLIVADGMGGHKGGAEASKLATRAYVTSAFTSTYLDPQVRQNGRKFTVNCLL